VFADEATDACRTFAPEVLCDGRLAHRRFCMDRYEYPNLEGVVPAVLADWHEAARACATEGKRLCSPEEWEFACEGTQMWPYPYGRERDATACNIDGKVDGDALAALGDPLRAPEERQRADGRLPSGARSRCVSPFGVYDLTGNVEEWVDNLQGSASADPFRSTRKGGHYGPGPARCRTASTANPPGARSPLAGFRCCAAARSAAAPAPPPAPGRSPRKHRMVEP
jgi:formylglycine-generating enzyme required for sulfatase activity